MRSTFMGLETARRGMFTQQGALYTTGHNIANANTPGYTRQRINFVQTEPYPAASMNRPQIPGQMGTGVQAGSIQRIRESFLDVQYRGENNKVGYWQARADALKNMEEVMNEPSETGLSSVMDQFWQSLQDLAVHPEDSGARSVVRQRGIAVAETFNYLSDSLNAIRNDLKSQIEVTAKKINSLADQINDINIEISEIEPHGYLPNDLYDERDRLIDELSELVNIKTTQVKSGGNALDIAEGTLTIDIVDKNGNPIFNMNGSKVSLVDGQNFKYNAIKVNTDGADNSVSTISIGGYTAGGENNGDQFESLSAVSAIHFGSAGVLKGLIESYGYDDNKIPASSAAGLYPEMLAELDNMAYTFATAFNQVHEDGNSLYEMKNGEDKIPFFSDVGPNDYSGFQKKAEITFVVDNSGSMSDKQNKVAEKLAQFVDGITSKGVDPANITFRLVSYENGNAIKVPATTNYSEISNALKGLEADTSTGITGNENLMDAIKTAAGASSSDDVFKHIVFVTDEDADDEAQLQDLLKEELLPKGIQVHGVYFTDNPDVAELNELVSQTGGQKVNLSSDDWETQIQVIGESIGAFVMSPPASSDIVKKGYAGRMQVAAPILENIDKIAASLNTDAGNGGNALKLAEVKNALLNYTEGETASFESYFKGVIGEMAIQSQQANRMANNGSVLRQSVEERRQSVSSVSLDEEMTNMIKFQHAYNASARMISLQDELLDKIINGMGTAGR